MFDRSETRSSETALLLIDFQRDFLADDGRMPIARNQVSPVLAAAREAISDARRDGRLIIAIGNEFKKTDWLLNILRKQAAIEGSDGAKWDERLPIDDAIYLPKWSSSAFSNPRLSEVLRQHGIRNLELTGLFARACVSSTAKDAVQRGFKVHIISKGVACAGDKSRIRSLKKLERVGANLSVGS